MDNAASDSYTYRGRQEKKSTPAMMIILVILLLISTGLLGYLYFKQTEELEKHRKQSAEMQEMLENQKTDLETELNNLIIEYDGLRTDNDSMNVKIEEQQTKIKQLLSLNASNLEKIKLYKKELGTLREIMRSYIVQIDSLNQRNQQLIAENRQVRGRMRKMEVEKEELITEKEELSSVVELASVLSAKNVYAAPLTKRSKEKFKSDKVEKIRVCFTVRENKVVAAGTKDVYIRILRPDDVLLASSTSNVFVAGGEELVFSAKRQLEYENQDIDICIYWDNTGSLIAGTYYVYVYAENYEIGSTTFALK